MVDDLGVGDLSTPRSMEVVVGMSEQVSWVSVTIQDSDGKIRVIEIPNGNEIEVCTEIEQDIPDDLTGVPNGRLDMFIPKRLTITITSILKKPGMIIRGAR